MSRHPSLRRVLVLGMLGFVTLLAGATMVYGYLVHEAAERLVWSTQLTAELERIAARRVREPGWKPVEDEYLRLFAAADGDVFPAPISGLDEGLQDEVAFDGREYVVMISGSGDARLALALDITELELSEREVAMTLLAFSIGMLLLLTPVLILGVGRLMRPMSELSRDIAALHPGSGPEAIDVPAGSSAELAVIADALRGYLGRQARFVERERAFIDSASHELRTPVAVISGAAELLAAREDLPAAARAAAERILATARFSEQLISLLLVLARSPEHLARSSERIALHRMIPEIVEDHRHLLRDQQLDVVTDELPSCQVLAPAAVLQAAIGNLLRNAIENSDHGLIRISLSQQGVVQIEDPGRGMSPEEISAIYSRFARGGQRIGQGIGLELIGRLCEHLGWRLVLEPGAGGGTRARLDLGIAVRR